MAKYRCVWVAIRLGLKNCIQVFCGFVLRLFWRYVVACLGQMFLYPVISAWVLNFLNVYRVIFVVPAGF